MVHPYYFCFQLFFDTVLEAVRNKFDRPFAEGGTISPFHSIASISSAAGTREYRQIRLARDVEKRMESIAFANSRQCPPLQAADLLAFRTRKCLVASSEA